MWKGGGGKCCKFFSFNCLFYSPSTLCVQKKPTDFQYQTTKTRPLIVMLRRIVIMVSSPGFSRVTFFLECQSQHLQGCVQGGNITIEWSSCVDAQCSPRIIYRRLVWCHVQRAYICLKRNKNFFSITFVLVVIEFYFFPKFSTLKKTGYFFLLCNVCE